MVASVQFCSLEAFPACGIDMAKIDWSDLENDLIGEIAKNIGGVEDFVSFSKVCPSWRLAAVKENWVIGPQLPWLALAEKYEEKGEGCKENRRGFFNFKRKKRYELDIPQFGPSRSAGSSLGWIVTITMDLEIHMINPLTRLKLRLPHVRTFKHMPRDEDGREERNPTSLDPTHPDYEPEWFIYFFTKALVCKRKQQLFVAVVYGEYDYFAIARPGDESWTEVEVDGQNPSSNGIRDAIDFNGQLLALNHDGSVQLCEFDWIQTPKFVTIVPGQFRLEYLIRAYLVESMGDLLMVQRWVFDDADFDYKTTRFDIYKLDFHNKKWIELKHLGDAALFLGDSYSFSLCSSELGCDSNVIYYTDDMNGFWYHMKHKGGHDIGIFNLNEKACSPLADNLANDDLISAVSCPVWMIPSLF